MKLFEKRKKKLVFHLPRKLMIFRLKDLEKKKKTGGEQCPKSDVKKIDSIKILIKKY